MLMTVQNSLGIVKLRKVVCILTGIPTLAGFPIPTSAFIAAKSVSNWESQSFDS